MTFDVEFQVNPMTLDVDMGTVYDVTGDEYERGYAEAKAEAQAVEDGILSGGLSTDYKNDRVTALRSYAMYATKITSLEAAALKTVGTGAFQICLNLRYALLPAAKSIGSHAFYGDAALTRVETNEVCAMGYNAFNGCAGLTALILRADGLCTLDTGALGRTGIASGTGYIYVPDDLVDSYKTATNWSTYAAQIKPLSEYGG